MKPSWPVRGELDIHGGDVAAIDGGIPKQGWLVMVVCLSVCLLHP